MTRKEALLYINDNADRNTIYEREAEDLIDSIYDDFESRTCENCKWGNEVGDKTALLCGQAVCQGLDEYGQYMVCRDFGCNKWMEQDD